MVEEKEPIIHSATDKGKSDSSQDNEDTDLYPNFGPMSPT